MTLVDVAAIVWIVAGVLFCVETVRTRRIVERSIRKMMEDEP